MLPVGLLLDRFAIGRQFVATAFVATAALSALTPTLMDASHGSFVLLFGVRLAMGAVQCGTFSNVHRLISRWAPPAELGRFMLTLCGTTVGTMLSWSLAGALIVAGGWQWPFYADAALLVAFVALWLGTVYDRPAVHPRCAEAEREFIEASKPATDGDELVREFKLIKG